MCPQKNQIKSKLPSNERFQPFVQISLMRQMKPPDISTQIDMEKVHREFASN